MNSPPFYSDESTHFSNQSSWKSVLFKNSFSKEITTSYISDISAESQTGNYNLIIEGQISPGNLTSIKDILVARYGEYTRDEWAKFIEDGQLKLGGEVIFDPGYVCKESKTFDGLIGHQSVCIQTDRSFSPLPLENLLYSKVFRGLIETMEIEMKKPSIIYHSRNHDALTNRNFFATMNKGSFTNLALKANKVPLCCTGLSWCCSGSYFAVSLGCRSVKVGWSICQPGRVIVQPYPRRDRVDIVLDHDASILCCCFHPDSPSLLACGSINGEVIVWDLNRANQSCEPMILRTLRSDEINLEITHVSWVRYSSLEETDPWLVMGGGADGTLHVWSIETILPLKTYKVAGGLCCFKTCDSICMVGLANGLVTKVEFARFYHDSASQEVRNTDNFRGHVGPVNSIAISPFNNHITASAGSDGIVRVFHSLYRGNVLSWESSTRSVACVEFSPHRPYLLMASTIDGLMCLFDLRFEAFQPFYTFDISEGFTNSSAPRTLGHQPGVGVSHFCFSPKERDLVALIDTDGATSVWNLNNMLSGSEGLHYNKNQLDGLFQKP